MFGEPCIPPTDAMVLRPQWTSRVKTNGKRQRCLCGDGSKQAQPQLHLDCQANFASCLEHPILQMFVAICAALGLILFTGDAQDAFAHVPTKTPYFLRVDKAFIEWY